jgi:hypothetical protein
MGCSWDFNGISNILNGFLVGYYCRDFMGFEWEFHWIS